MSTPIPSRIPVLVRLPDLKSKPLPAPSQLTAHRTAAGAGVNSFTNSTNITGVVAAARLAVSHVSGASSSFSSSSSAMAASRTETLRAREMTVHIPLLPLHLVRTDEFKQSVGHVQAPKLEPKARLSRIIGSDGTITWMETIEY